MGARSGQIEMAVIVEVPAGAGRRVPRSDAPRRRESAVARAEKDREVAEFVLDGQIGRPVLVEVARDEAGRPDADRGGGGRIEGGDADGRGDEEGPGEAILDALARA